MVKSLYEQLSEAAAAAVTDIREKVVEEGWFGRVVTDGPQPEAQAPAQGGNSTWQELVQQSRDTKDETPPPELGIER